jgi:hypothetical protein
MIACTPEPVGIIHTFGESSSFIYLTSFSLPPAARGHKQGHSYSLPSSPRGLFVLSSMPSVSTVHHEEHHQRAQEKQDKWERSKDVSGMLSHQKESTDGDQDKQDPRQP